MTEHTPYIDFCSTNELRSSRNGASRSAPAAPEGVQQAQQRAATIAASIAAHVPADLRPPY